MRFESRPDKRRGEIERLLVKRGLFIVMLGILPAVMAVVFLGRRLSMYGLAPVLTARSALWTVSLTTALALLSLILRRAPSATANYPQIRVREWTRATHLVNIASWGVYLYVYEFGYRGFLLFPLAESFGPWPAIAVSVGLYAALHMNKGPGEALGCIPVGIAFSAAALHTGTIWVTYVAHFVSAAINDVIAFRTNPEFRMVAATEVRRQERRPPAVHLPD